MWYNSINPIISLIISVLQSAFAFGVLYWDVRIAIVLPYEILQENGAFESNQKLKMAAIFGVVVSISCLLISFVAEIEREMAGNTGLVIDIGWVSILQVLLFYWLAFREKACKIINE